MCSQRLILGTAALLSIVSVSLTSTSCPRGTDHRLSSTMRTAKPILTLEHHHQRAYHRSTAHGRLTFPRGTSWAAYNLAACRLLEARGRNTTAASLERQPRGRFLDQIDLGQWTWATAHFREDDRMPGALSRRQDSMQTGSDAPAWLRWLWPFSSSPSRPPAACVCQARSVPGPSGSIASMGGVAAMDRTYHLPCSRLPYPKPDKGQPAS